MPNIRSLPIAFIAALAMPSVVADEWVVNRLRGVAERYDGQQWHPLRIGDVVENSRHVRTHHRSRMELVRGDEVLELEPATFLAIHEASGRKMTTVEQSLGSVTVQADKRDVQHFEVQTPMLAAVVKGTNFSVTIKNNKTEVDVRSGAVQVADGRNEISANVTAGQSAVASETGAFGVSGPGSQDTVYMLRGVPIAASQLEQITGQPLPTNTEVFSSYVSLASDNSTPLSAPSSASVVAAQPQVTVVPTPPPSAQPAPPSEDTSPNPNPNPGPNPEEPEEEEPSEEEPEEESEETEPEEEPEEEEEEEEEED